jgi:hypothetical protein
MTNVAPPFCVVTQDVPLANSEMVARRLTGVIPVLSEEIIHELRQPLGIIDSLAYYLELTADDERTHTYLERIRAMVSQANGILERVSNPRPELAASHPFLAGS